MGQVVPGSTHPPGQLALRSTDIPFLFALEMLLLYIRVRVNKLLWEVWHLAWFPADTRPPIHLLHRIKSILCYEEEGPVSYE